MKIKVLNTSGRNRFEEVDALYETFQELLLRCSIKKLYEETYKYLKENPHGKIKDDKIKNEMERVIFVLLKEGMPYTRISFFYSNFLSDNSLRQYALKSAINRKAQSVIIEDKNKRIDNLLEVALIVKRDFKKRSCNGYKWKTVT